ncbi:MAG TPA: tyrosine-protein phosphatase [Clostridia bacterium]|nr:tyrosine-protein phosphatase [Clostridia bacterium]
MTVDPLCFVDLYNVRDLGGFPTRDGRMTRWERYVRASGEGVLSKAEKERLYRHGVRTIVDLRHRSEIARCPSPLMGYRDIRYVSFNLLGQREFKLNPQCQDLGDLYKAWVDRVPERIAFVFEAFYEHREACVLFHCAAGKDRTGVLAALLMGLAGCFPEDIVASYALSYENNRRVYTVENAPPEIRPYLPSDPAYMRKLLRHLDARYGGAEAYLLGAGVRRRSLQVLKVGFVGPAAH